MFEFSLAQSQSVLPVDLHDHVSFNQNAFLAGTVEDAQFPPPKKLTFYQATAPEVSFGSDENAQFPPPKKIVIDQFNLPASDFANDDAQFPPPKK